LLSFHWEITSINVPIFFFFTSLGFELRILCLLVRHCSTTWVTFYISYLWDRVTLYAQASLDNEPLCGEVVWVPTQQEWQLHTTIPSHWLRWDLENFLPRFCASPPPKELGLLIWATAPGHRYCFLDRICLYLPTTHIDSYKTTCCRQGTWLKL
jgi:hypothetical protein